MAIISRKWKFIFSLNPRTASTATASIMGKRLEGTWLPKDNIIGDGGKIICDKKHSAFPELLENDLIEGWVYNDYLKVTTIRNPFDSLYSFWSKKKHAYQDLLEDKNSFIYKKEGFVEDILFVRDHTVDEWVIKNYANAAKHGKQAKVNSKWIEGADMLMRFENIQEDFKKFLNRINYSGSIEIPTINQTAGREKDYRSAFNSKSKEILENVLKTELEELDYKF